VTTPGQESALARKARKARGAFFTPEAVARYLVDWAVRTPADRVLEPSCGEAAFLLAVGRRLRQLGAEGSLMPQLHGVELHAASAEHARARLEEADLDADIVVGDFLRGEPRPIFEAVLGNPPYVRYQAFSGESRAAANRAAMRAGVTLTSLASSWAAFTVHSTLHVQPGGRLGLVLPAEMLSVNYAAPVREFLLRQFARIRLVLFTERVFPGVMEDVVLLLAESRGQGPTTHFELLESRNGHSLAELVTGDARKWTPQGSERWSRAILDSAAAETLGSVMGSGHFLDLNVWGETTLGMVTGNNAYFALADRQVRELALEDQDVVRLSPPGSRHLRALSLTAAGLNRLATQGSRTWLFRPNGEPSAAARRYIVHGQRRGVDTAYKCRVRAPWWRVPYQPPADLLLTYMNADTARLCRNEAQAHHLNSVHGVYLRPQHRRLGPELLPLASLNSVTLLGAELVGRSYGGGVLKLEPREADRWPMPSPDLVASRVHQLRSIRPAVVDRLTAGRLLEVAAMIDEVLLSPIGLTPPDLNALRRGRQALHDRRAARSGSK